MAQLQLKWESLPEELRDVKAFMPIIIRAIAHRFQESQGYCQEVIGATEYRVRQGWFRGWDVRVWRQENLILSVSGGSQFASFLPIFALVLSGLTLGVLVNFGPGFGGNLSTRETKQGGMLLMAIGTVIFLGAWVVLWTLTRPLEWAMGRDTSDRELLDEIRSLLPREVIELR